MNSITAFIVEIICAIIAITFMLIAGYNAYIIHNIDNSVSYVFKSILLGIIAEIAKMVNDEP